MKNRFLSVLMALCMVLSLAPTMAWADDYIDYNIEVGGVRVTSENKGNITGGNIKAGSVSYDPDANTLTLDDAKIVIDESTVHTYCCIYSRDSLTIVVKGENTLTRTVGDDAAILVQKPGSTLTIEGNGTLNVNATKEGASAIWANGDITIDENVQVNATGKGYGIGAQGGNITVANTARVIAKGETSALIFQK